MPGPRSASPPGSPPEPTAFSYDISIATRLVSGSTRFSRFSKVLQGSFRSRRTRQNPERTSQNPAEPRIPPCPPHYTGRPIPIALKWPSKEGATKGIGQTAGENQGTG